MGNLGSFSNKDFRGHSLIMNKREHDKYTKYTNLYDTRLHALDLEEHWSNWSRQIYLMGIPYTCSFGVIRHLLSLSTHHFTGLDT